MMVKKLEEAFSQISKLPPSEQEAVATWLLEELASEKRWAKAFSKSQKQLARMGEEALKEFKQGKTRAFDKDSDLADD